MASPPAQVLREDGELAPSDHWFPQAQLSSDPFFVVAITGPQASGKSTLVNALFQTSFPVASRASVATATTRGILASHTASPTRQILLLDVEGADARARGRDGKIFAAQCAAFVTSVADVVIVNLWFHDACRLDSAAHVLLRSIFSSAAYALHEGHPSKTALLVAVRDFDDDSHESSESLTSLIRQDVSFHPFPPLACVPLFHTLD